MRYLIFTPSRRYRPPPGRIVVHNHVTVPGPQFCQPGAILGLHGFRAWTERGPKRRRLVRCRCPWASHLQAHYSLVDQGLAKDWRRSSK